MLPERRGSLSLDDLVCFYRSAYGASHTDAMARTPRQLLAYARRAFTFEARQEAAVQRAAALPHVASETDRRAYLRDLGKRSDFSLELEDDDPQREQAKHAAAFEELAAMLGG